MNLRKYLFIYFAADLNRIQIDTGLVSTDGNDGDVMMDIDLTISKSTFTFYITRETVFTQNSKQKDKSDEETYFPL